MLFNSFKFIVSVYYYILRILLQGDKGDKGERGLTTTLTGDQFPTGIIEGPPGPPGPPGNYQNLLPFIFNVHNSTFVFV